MTKRKHEIARTIVAMVATVCALPAAAQSLNAGSEKPITVGNVAARKSAEQFITEANLREHLTFIASDDLQGRDTPSPGLDKAAEYIASHLKKWGVKPMGGDGSYFQKITLTRRKVDEAKSTATLNGTSLAYEDDFLVRGEASATASGDLLYVGHGYVIPSRGIDAYKGIDVRGKILVVSGELPKGMSPRDLNRLERGTGRVDAPQYAAKNGAVGVVVLPSERMVQRWNEFRSLVNRPGAGYAPKERNAESETSSVPTITLSPKGMERLFAGEKFDDKAILETRPTEPFAFSSDKKLTFTTAVTQETTTTQNVVGVVEGRDPKLKNEYVAFGAHYDHVGVGSSGDGDRIYNGADDDGSGTVALMAMAQAASQNKEKPKRSLLFVWHAGEEKGLWGSRYFVENPTVPLKQIVTQLNIDMIGRSKGVGDEEPRNRELSAPGSVYVIGSRRLSNQLGDLAEAVNKDYLNLEYNYRYDEPNDPNRFYFRSDHYNYAQKGIPIIFWFDGEHVDYHGVDDEVDRIDFTKLQNVTRTIFATALEVANREQRPALDKPASTP